MKLTNGNGRHIILEVEKLIRTLTGILPENSFYKPHIPSHVIPCTLFFHASKFEHPFLFSYTDYIAVTFSDINVSPKTNFAVPQVANHHTTFYDPDLLPIGLSVLTSSEPVGVS